MSNFRYGWVKAPIDTRDRMFVARPRIAGALPDEFRVPYFASVPNLNQGMLGTCGPNSSAEDIFCDELADLGAGFIGSRLFLYYNTRRRMGTLGMDSGVDNRSMMDSLLKDGLCPESLWPYSDDPVRYNMKPTPDCYAAGLANRILGYSFVNSASTDSDYLNSMKAAIFTHQRGLVYGVDVYKGIESDEAAETGNVPDPRPGETPIGGHDITVFFWLNSRGRLGFRNHWVKGDGSPWGNGGNGTFSYEYVMKHRRGSDACLIDAVAPKPAPVPPTPQPTPSPTPAVSYPAKVTIWDNHGIELWTANR